jgi:hypothetical protein
MHDAMRDWDVIERERKQAKRLRRVTKNAIYCLGGGIGLMIVKYLYPAIDNQEQAQALMNGLGLVLLAYGAVVMLAMLFLRSQVFKINFFMLFFAVPAAVIKLLMDMHQ